MTAEDYLRKKTYKGKHEKREYTVWRVLGPAGPQERTTVWGRQEAIDLCKGAWDYEITDDKGVILCV